MGANQGVGGAWILLAPERLLLGNPQVVHVATPQHLTQQHPRHRQPCRIVRGSSRVTPDWALFQYFFSVKKETVPQTSSLATCGSITFKIRPGRIYPSSRVRQVLVRGILLCEGRIGSGQPKDFAGVQGWARQRDPRLDQLPAHLRVTYADKDDKADLQADGIRLVGEGFHRTPVNCMKMCGRWCWSRRRRSRGCTRRRRRIDRLSRSLKLV